MRQYGWRDALPAAGVACGGLAAAPLLIEGNLVAVLVALLVGLALAAAPRLVHDVERIRPLVLLTYAVHVLAVIAIRLGSLALGRGGFVTGDDAAYADISWRLAQIWHGVPQIIAGDAYLIGTYVYVESAIFYLLGPNVVVVQLLNAGLASALVYVAYKLARRMFDERAALATGVLVAFYPSVLVWSSLNLKDALALFLVGLVLWSLLELQRLPRVLVLAAVPLLLYPMVTLRRYLFLELSVIFPLAMLVAPPFSLRRRVGLTAFAAASSLIVALVASSALPALGSDPLTTLESTRYSMGIGARTSFQDRLPVREGATYVVAEEASGTLVDGAGVPQEGGAATPSPTVVHVQPGTQIAVLMSTETPRTTEAGIVYVRPGDIIVVGDPTTTPAPVSQQLTLPLRESAKAVALERADPESAVPRTFAYIPRGLAYVLFAPFPWSISRAADLLTVPEMLLWYVLLGCALWSTARYWRRWPELSPLLVYVAGTIGIFVLTEGNVGTLFRHRAMIIPFTIVLASPGLLALLGVLKRRIAHRRLLPSPR